MNYISSYPISAFLYIIIVFLTTLFAYFSIKANDKRIKLLFVFIIIILLTLFAGFRGELVGTDTAQYLSHFDRWLEGMKNKFEYEPGLYIVGKISFLIINESQFIFIISALLINVLIVLRTWTFRDVISFPGAMFLYSASYYILTFSGLRQWLAISIVYFGSKYLFERKYYKYTVFVIIGSLFHNSAIMALILPIIAILAKRFKESKQKKHIIYTMIISPVFLGIVFLILVKFNVISDHESYISNITWSGGTGLIIWIKIFMAIFIYLSFSKKELFNAALYNKVFSVYFIGLIMSIPGYYISSLARVGWYFIIFEIIFYAMIMKTKNKKKSLIFTLIIVAYTLALFLIELKGSGRGHMPYYPFWDK